MFLVGLLGKVKAGMDSTVKTMGKLWKHQPEQETAPPLNPKHPDSIKKNGCPDNLCSHARCVRMHVRTYGLTRTRLGHLNESTGRGFNSRPTPPTVQKLGAEARVPAVRLVLERPLAALQASAQVGPNENLPGLQPPLPSPAQLYKSGLTLRNTRAPVPLVPQRHETIHPQYGPSGLTIDHSSSLQAIRPHYGPSFLTLDNPSLLQAI
ncbi:hypothetical protein E5288_WYG017902 [Bos mutus]|uniref:Uncharacterized protein n=1 Tax=Bos mutus TaxID=72004 RepID=A0A6B0SAA9_9CETA|nr:hypothetical protein [Bos mutus]